MSKETFTFIAGTLLIVVPFLGIPEAWRTYLVVSIGVVLTLVGYALRRREYLNQIERSDGERVANSFVETTEKLFDERTLQ